MLSFHNFVANKHIEPLMMEVVAGIACCEVNPEQWLIEWIRENNPQLEAPILTIFNQLAITEADGPFPNRGGMLAGLKNWWNSMKGGVQSGWDKGKSQFQSLSSQKIEDAFQNAFKYVNTLVSAFDTDPRIQQLKQQNPQIGNTAQQLVKMRDSLNVLGRQIGGFLNTNSQQPEINQKTDSQVTNMPSDVQNTFNQTSVDSQNLAARNNGPAPTQANTEELPQGITVADTGYTNGNFNWKPIDTDINQNTVTQRNVMPRSKLPLRYVS